MKNLVFILLLVSFGANAQNKTVILKIPTVDTTTILAPYLRNTGFGLLKSGQTVSADTSLLATRLRVQKGIDSLGAKIATTYVPYTGATTNLDLGTNSLLAKAVYIEGTSTFQAGLIMKQISGLNYITGDYTQITPKGGYDLNIAYNQTGSIRREYQLSVALFSNGDSFQYLMPRKDGTFAMISDIPSVAGVYLPLTGGTLTGALIGTSAIFSTGNVLIGSATDNASGAKLQVTGAAMFSSSVSASGIFSGRTTNGQAFGCGNGVDSDMGIFVQTGNIAFSNSGTASGMSFALGGATRFSIASTGAATFNNLAGTGSRIVVADASGTLTATTAASTSGTYTPTITLVTNAASSTARVCQYMRVGSVVTVSGYVTVTATTPAASSRIYMSLPISSSFTSTAQAGGAGGVPGGANIGTVIFANSTATTVSMDFLPVSGATDYWFTYTYQIL